MSGLMHLKMSVYEIRDVLEDAKTEFNRKSTAENYSVKFIACI